MTFVTIRSAYTVRGFDGGDDEAFFLLVAA
jgi:hypothetical protein